MTKVGFGFSSVARTALLALGFVLTACDPFPLSEIQPVPAIAGDASYSVTSTGLSVLLPAQGNDLQVVADGFQFGDRHCTADEQLCVIGGVLR